MHHLLGWDPHVYIVRQAAGTLPVCVSGWTREIGLTGWGDLHTAEENGEFH